MSLSEILDNGVPHPWANIRVQNANIDGNLSVSGSFDISGSFNIDGDLSVSGNVNIGQILTVDEWVTSKSVNIRNSPGTAQLNMYNSTPLLRWGVGLGNSEGGANSGSDLFIWRYNDAQSSLGVPVSINRSTGNFRTNLGTSIGGTPHYVLSNGPSGNPYISFGLMGNNTGSNIGSNLIINTYNDAGAVLSTALTIARSTGIVIIPSLNVSRLSLPNWQLVGGVSPSPVTQNTDEGGQHIFSISIGASSTASVVIQNSFILTIGKVIVNTCGFTSDPGSFILQQGYSITAGTLTINYINPSAVPTGSGTVTVQYLIIG